MNVLFARWLMILRMDGSGGSVYYIFHGDVPFSREVSQDGIDFVKEMIDIFSVADAFVMDIGLTPEGWKIVEINCINSAGFYHLNPRPLFSIYSVISCSKMAEYLTFKFRSNKNKDTFGYAEFGNKEQRPFVRSLRHGLYSLFPTFRRKSRQLYGIVLLWYWLRPVRALEIYF